jgi:amidophosphoribosyltransferase
MKILSAPNATPISNQNLIPSFFPEEKCGVFGVFGEGMEAARLVHAGLWSLQHRGQESSGIASSEGASLRVYKNQGLVSRVYNEEHLALLSGYCAIGHNRYATSGKSTVSHAQPIIGAHNVVALAHNGNLPDTTLLEKHLTKESLIAVRDSHGIRPLSMGKLNGGYVFSSETCGLDTIGATYIRDVHPGEMVVVTKSEQPKSYNLNAQKKSFPSGKLDIFEFVYFARSDSMLLGKRVDSVRKNFGKQLAAEYKIKADVVIPIPEIIAGKSVAVIDDSIVRGTTAKKLIERIRSAGAKEIHLLISCPPVLYPDFYGIDTPSQKELVAFQMPIKKIAKYIGADSLHFLSYEGLIKATGLPESVFSTSCFTGEYPCSIGKRKSEVKSAKKE